MFQAQPIFKDPNRYHELADPLLHRNFPVRAFNQAVAVAAMCLNDEPAARPMISDVVTALTFLGNPSGHTASDDTPSQLPSSSPPSEQQTQGQGSSNVNIVDKNNVVDRERAVAEAIQWGSASRTHAVATATARATTSAPAKASSS